jgi:hypothetical protein
MYPIGCPETSVRNYHYSLGNNSEGCNSHLLRGRSLKPRISYNNLPVNSNAIPLKDDTSVEEFKNAVRIDTLMNRNHRGTNIGKRGPCVLVIDT